MKGSQKVNVLPGKAWAAVEGLDKAVMETVAKKVTEKTKVSYELTEEDGLVKIMAVGYGAHAASPEKGINALTGLIEYLCALPLAESEAVSKLRSLKKLLRASRLSLTAAARSVQRTKTCATWPSRPLPRKASRWRRTI